MQRADSEASAANGALALVGHPPIAAIDETGAGATAARSRFADVRDHLLRLHDWNFAAAWVVPAADPQRGLGGLAIRYPLPDDCLLVRGVEGLSTDEWAVEAAAVNPTQDAGDRVMLVTNAAAPRVSYTRRIENVSLWDPLFLRQFQLRLAAAIAAMIGRDVGKQSELDNRAAAELAAVKRRDRREKAPEDVTRATSWVAARRQWVR